MRRPSVRDDLATVAPYISPQQQARYRMNVNESPYSPPPAVLEEAFAEVRQREVNRYPERDAAPLQEAVAAHLGVAPESIWLANGSNEVFQHLFLAFGGSGRKTLVFEPTYSLHTLIPRITGTAVATRPRTDGFGIDPDEARRAVAEERPDLVLLCSPNNPTGNLAPPDLVRATAEGASLVVVDEAYVEFARPGSSVLDLVEELPNVVVVRTFSKAWRLAGVRLGYLVGAPSIVRDLLRVRLPYHLSVFTQAMGTAALRHAADALEHVGAIVAERERMGAGLSALGLRVHPSEANFVLFDVDDPGRVWRDLADRGVLVRRYDGAPRLERSLRVTAGLPDETDAFLAAMDEVVG
ncbi:MAG TPA: histidinol-phosphate transaminase [Actinomycetota bacterium]|nr:histidinol-phosphate transaminase [Actinomycetota bacterium]